MDSFGSKRPLIFVIILLVILNIATLLMLWLGRPERLAPPGEGRGPDQEQARTERLLRDQLGFDRAQIDRYLAARRQHREQVDSLNNEIRELKRQMFGEVLRDGPEPTLSDSLLALTQQKQVLIERLTFQHLTDLKKLCGPEQREKLRFLIHDLFRRTPRRDDAAAAPPPPGQRPPARPQENR